MLVVTDFWNELAAKLWLELLADCGFDLGGKLGCQFSGELSGQLLPNLWPYHKLNFLLEIFEDIWLLVRCFDLLLRTRRMNRSTSVRFMG